MEKDFEKLMKELNNLMNEMGDMFKEFDKASKEATGKTLDEIIKMPVKTPEERKAFVEELLKIKEKLDGKKPRNFDGSYVKITGGKHCTSFEAKGSKNDVIHLLAQGVSAMIKNLDLDKEKSKEFLNMFIDEVKSMNDNGIII